MDGRPRPMPAHRVVRVYPILHDMGVSVKDTPAGHAFVCQRLQLRRMIQCIRKLADLDQRVAEPHVRYMFARPVTQRLYEVFNEALGEGANDCVALVLDRREQLCMRDWLYRVANTANRGMPLAPLWAQNVRLSEQVAQPVMMHVLRALQRLTKHQMVHGSMSLSTVVMTPPQQAGGAAEHAEGSLAELRFPGDMRLLSMLHPGTTVVHPPMPYVLGYGPSWYHTAYVDHVSSALSETPPPSLYSLVLSDFGYDYARQLAVVLLHNHAVTLRGLMRHATLWYLSPERLVDLMGEHAAYAFVHAPDLWRERQKGRVPGQRVARCIWSDAVQATFVGKGGASKSGDHRASVRYTKEGGLMSARRHTTGGDGSAFSFPTGSAPPSPVAGGGGGSSGGGVEFFRTPATGDAASQPATATAIPRSPSPAAGAMGAADPLPASDSTPSLADLASPPALHGDPHPLTLPVDLVESLMNAEHIALCICNPELLLDNPLVPVPSWSMIQDAAYISGDVDSLLRCILTQLMNTYYLLLARGNDKAYVAKRHEDLTACFRDIVTHGPAYLLDCQLKKQAAGGAGTGVPATQPAMPPSPTAHESVSSGPADFDAPLSRGRDHLHAAKLGRGGSGVFVHFGDQADGSADASWLPEGRDRSNSGAHSRSGTPVPMRAMSTVTTVGDMSAPPPLRMPQRQLSIGISETTSSVPVAESTKSARSTFATLLRFVERQHHNTVIHEAAFTMCLPLLQLLSEAGYLCCADLLQPNRDGDTPLACLAAGRNMFSALQRHGQPPVTRPEWLRSVNLEQPGSDDGDLNRTRAGSSESSRTARAGTGGPGDSVRSANRSVANTSSTDNSRLPSSDTAAGSGGLRRAAKSFRAKSGKDRVEPADVALEASGYGSLEALYGRVCDLFQGIDPAVYDVVNLLPPWQFRRGDISSLNPDALDGVLRVHADKRRTVFRLLLRQFAIAEQALLVWQTTVHELDQGSIWDAETQTWSFIAALDQYFNLIIARMRTHLAPADLQLESPTTLDTDLQPPQASPLLQRNAVSAMPVLERPVSSSLPPSVTTRVLSLLSSSGGSSSSAGAATVDTNVHARTTPVLPGAVEGRAVTPNAGVTRLSPTAVATPQRGGGLPTSPAPARREVSVGGWPGADLRMPSSASATSTVYRGRLESSTSMPVEPARAPIGSGAGATWGMHRSSSSVHWPVLPAGSGTVFHDLDCCFGYNLLHDAFE